MRKHTEARLEEAIVDQLCSVGGYSFVDYRQGEARDRYCRHRQQHPRPFRGWKSLPFRKKWQ